MVRKLQFPLSVINDTQLSKMVSRSTVHTTSAHTSSSLGKLSLFLQNYHPFQYQICMNMINKIYHTMLFTLK